MIDRSKLQIVQGHRKEDKVRRKWIFEHHGLDAWHVAYDALVKGHAIAEDLPRGCGKLRDQLDRALLGAYLQTSEAAARRGKDRKARFRAARAEAGEAAAALEGAVGIGVARADDVDEVLELLWRLAAMLHGLGKLDR